MKKSFLILTLLIFWTNSLFAQTVKLQEGQEAPYTGFLVTEKTAEEAAKNKLRVIQLKDLQVSQEALTDFHRDNAKEARKELTKAQIDTFLYVTGAFVLGVLVTGFAAKMNQKIGQM